MFYEIYTYQTPVIQKWEKHFLQLHFSISVVLPLILKELLHKFMFTLTNIKLDFFFEVN